MLSTLSRFQRALTPETVARHQPRGGGRQSDGTPPINKDKTLIVIKHHIQNSSYSHKTLIVIKLIVIKLRTHSHKTQNS